MTSWMAREAPEISADLFFDSRFWLVCIRVCDEAALRGCKPPRREGLLSGLALMTLGRPRFVGFPYS